MIAMTGKINLDEKFLLFGEHWRPKVIAALNGQEIKLIKVLGTFPWHTHAQDDELSSWCGRAGFGSNFATM